MKVPFSPPRIDEKTIEAVTEVLRSGWITTGPKTKEFERRLAEYCNVSNVLCVNSASAGLELVLHWFGVGPGDEVIVPAYTYTATANVVLHCGAKPVMVDVKDDFNIDVAQIEKAITPRTKVIMPVDIAGWPCNYGKINDLVRRSDIVQMFSPATEEQRKLGRMLVLSDAAHSLGALYANAPTGCLTDITVFSFHAVKNLTTAEGGAICFNLQAPFNNSEIYKTLCVKSLHGQTKDAFSKMKVGAWRYDVVEAGYKCNMTDILAAIGLVELERYDNYSANYTDRGDCKISNVGNSYSMSMLETRYKIFNIYSEEFSKHDCFIIPPYGSYSDGTRSSFHAYLLRIKGATEEQRDEIIQKISENDVAVNVHFQPLPLLTCYKNLGYKIEDYPVAYKNYSCEISLPVFYDMTYGQIELVIKSVIDATYSVLGLNK